MLQYYLLIINNYNFIHITCEMDHLNVNSQYIESSFFFIITLRLAEYIKQNAQCSFSSNELCLELNYNIQCLNRRIYMVENIDATRKQKWHEWKNKSVFGFGN